MKKVLFLLISCLLITLNLQAQSSVTGVTLSQDTIILPVNMSNDTILIAHVQTNILSEKEVSWWIIPTGSPLIDHTTTIETLAADTIFYFKSKNAVGELKIRAETSSLSGNKQADCVVKTVIPADGITLSATDTIFMYIDDATTDATLNLDPLIATISPVDATDAFVLWENLNDDIIEIDTTGNTCHITALKRDTAKIAAKVCYNYDLTGELFGVFTDTCIIVVKTAEIDAITITGLEANDINADGEYMLTKGDEFNLTAHLSPARGIFKTVVWERSVPGIIGTTTVTGHEFDTIRTFTANNVGTSEIIAISKQTSDDFPSDNTQWVTDTIKVRVYGIRAEGMRLEHDTIRMDRATTVNLRAIVSPDTTTNKDIEWSVFGDPIVTVSTPAAINDTICEIYALWSGETKIVAKSLDNTDYTDTCVVQVFVPLDSVVLKIEDTAVNDFVSILDTIRIEISDTINLKSIIYPDTATIKAVTWSLEDSTLIQSFWIAEDSIRGFVGLLKGVGKIYAEVNDRDIIYKDSCVLSIDFKPIDSVRLFLPDTLDLLKFEELQLTVTVAPFNCTNDTVQWTSSDSNIIDIISTEDTICYIKALDVGEAKIYVVSKADPALKDSCVFRVSQIDVEEVILPNDTLELYLDHTMLLIATIDPSDASDKLLAWTSTDPTVVEIVSSVNDTVCELLGKALGEAMIYAVASDGVTKDSCVIKVIEQMIFLESDTSNVNGSIELFLTVPATASLTGSFELQLPDGFGLTKGELSPYRSALAGTLKDFYDLTITCLNDSAYTFTILPKETATASEIEIQAGTKIKLLDIVYTVYDINLDDRSINYIAKLVDVVFELSDDTTIEKDEVTVVIKTFSDPTGNVLAVKPPILTYMYANRLYVNTDQAETIHVFSVNGQLLFSGRKNTGQAEFNLNIPDKTLIVRGGSGWVNKVANP